MTAKAGLAGLRMYDLRHHAITALLENPEVSEETAEAIAGHIGREMKRRYSHIRIERMREAVFVLNSGQSPTAKHRDKAPAMTNADIIQMWKDGFGAEVLAASIKSSPCLFKTTPAELAELKQAGIPEPVIVAMLRRRCA